MRAAREVNLYKEDWVVEKFSSTLNDFLQENSSKSEKDVIIAFYGLAFKPNIDDLRESPAVNIVKKISEIHKCCLIAVEPNIKKLPNLLRGIELHDLDFALEKGDIHVLLVAHNEFNKVPSHCRYILDTKGVW